MQIDIHLLLAWGAITKRYRKNEIIFNEDERPTCYYQIQDGKVRMVNINNDGKEFVQGVFESGQSFGEPPLFINQPYPATAITMEPTTVIKLAKDKLFKLLQDNHELQFKMIEVLAQRVYNKAITAREIINNDPEGRILGFLKSIKTRITSAKQPIQIPHTRQEIANFTGLRVETVIRTLKQMEAKHLVSIINRKLWF
jgi:CRP-like cAMP-binding protein